MNFPAADLLRALVAELEKPGKAKIAEQRDQMVDQFLTEQQLQKYLDPKNER